MNFRKMYLSDYNSVLALWQACEGVSLRDADSRDGIEKYLRRNPGLSFIAEQDHQLVGTIMGGHDAKRGYIQHLAVADAVRHSGVASKLVDLCLQALKTEGILKSHVHVLITNEAAKSFWIKRGWFERAEIAMFSYINTSEGNP